MALLIDENFDREHAPSGRSRYAAEVRRQVDQLETEMPADSG